MEIGGDGLKYVDVLRMGGDAGRCVQMDGDVWR